MPISRIAHEKLYCSWPGDRRPVRIYLKAFYGSINASLSMINNFIKILIIKSDAELIIIGINTWYYCLEKNVLSE